MDFTFLYWFIALLCINPSFDCQSHSVVYCKVLLDFLLTTFIDLVIYFELLNCINLHFDNLFNKYFVI